MNEPLSKAFIVLAVGMITVFTILSLVVFSGNLLIKVANKYFPEKIPQTKSLPHFPKKSDGIDKSKIAAIVAAVDVITKGKGQIKNIEKT